MSTSPVLEWMKECLSLTGPDGVLGSDPAVLGGPDLLHQISQVPYLSADSLGFLLELPVCLLQLGALGVQRLLLGAFLLPVPRRCRLVLLHLLLFLMHHFRSIRVGSGVGFGSGGACRPRRGFGDPAVAVRRVAARLFRSIRVGSGVGFGSGGACRPRRGFGDPTVAV